MEIRNRPSAKGLVAISTSVFTSLTTFYPSFEILPLNTRVEGVHVDKVSDLLR